MKERPILFTPAMAAAVYAGTKTQTRRVVKPQPIVGRYGPRHPEKPNGIIGPLKGSMGGGDYHIWRHPKMDIPLIEGSEWAIERHCPYGVPGDRLWVRESFRTFLGDDARVEYRAGGVLEITDDLLTKMCRHQGAVGCSQREAEDVMAGKRMVPAWRPSLFMPRCICRSVLEVVGVRVERVESITEADAIAEGFASRAAFLDTFYRINKRAPEGSNPWVWVIEFRRIGASANAGGCCPPAPPAEGKKAGGGA